LKKTKMKKGNLTVDKNNETTKEVLVESLELIVEDYCMLIPKVFEKIDWPSEAKLAIKLRQ